MVEVKSIPKLRFPEFDGIWQEKVLGSLGKFQGGGTPSKKVPGYWKGDIPWISSSDIFDGDIHNIRVSRFINELALKESATKIIHKGSVLFVSRVGVGKLAISEHPICTSQDFTNFTPKHTNSFFLGYYFLSKKFLLQSFNQGTSIKGFTKSDIESLKLFLPSLPEQQKIASFLTSVDDKIQQLTRKKTLLEQYKKSVMQKIFSQEIRFKDDEGKEFPEWEVKKIGRCLGYVQPTNYLVTSTEYEDKYSTPVLTAGKTFILGYTDEEFGIYDKNLPVIIFDDFTTSSQFVDFPFKAKSSAMKILTAKENTDIKFMYEALQMIKYETGAHGRNWISIFAEMEILIPSYREQNHIASFLTSIDQKIESVNTQLIKTQAFKKGLLQQMFV